VGAGPCGVADACGRCAAARRRAGPASAQGPARAGGQRPRPAPGPLTAARPAHSRCAPRAPQAASRCGWRRYARPTWASPASGSRWQAAWCA
jgi:hypothetical protein